MRGAGPGQTGVPSPGPPGRGVNPMEGRQRTVWLGTVTADTGSTPGAPVTDTSPALSR